MPAADPPDARPETTASRTLAGNAENPAAGKRTLAALSKALGGALLAAAICLAVFWSTMRYHKAEADVPLAYTEDAILFQCWVKSVSREGWYLHNSLVGAPSTQDMHDFPQVETFHFLIIKALACCTSRVQLIVHAFVILSFVATTLTALLALRNFGVDYPIALAMSILYSFLPYHFFRIGGHYFLACYYIVPLSIMLAIWIYQGRLQRDGGESGVGGSGASQRGRVEPGAGESEGSRRRGKWAQAGIWLAALVICVLQASSGVYYAFFAMLFQTIAVAAACLERRSPRPMAIAGPLLACTFCVVMANLGPTLMYWREHGTNPHVASRPAIDTEHFGYKLSAALLPIPDHRIPALKNLRKNYENQSVDVNENNWSCQGSAANIGLVALLGTLLCRRHASRLLEQMCVLALCGILFATQGGLGMIFSLLVSPMIRCQNRISVFISFFSLVALALVLQWAWRRHGATPWRRVALGGGLCGLVWVGLWDQVPAPLFPDYEFVSRKYRGDADFVQRVERSLPPGSMVYQLPYAPFPEGPRLGDYTSLEGMRFALHSDTLRWSCGAVRGREASHWLDVTANLPMAEQLRAIADKGFRGVQVNRRAFADGGAAIERQLCESLGVQPIVSKSEAESFFSLEPYVAAGNSRPVR